MRFPFSRFFVHGIKREQTDTEPCTVSVIYRVISSYDESELGRLGIKIFLDHQCYLEGDGMLKLSQIQSRQLTDLLQTVNQRIAVNEQLSRGFGYVQIVLKEALNGQKSLAVKRLQTSLLEHFPS